MTSEDRSKMHIGSVEVFDVSAVAWAFLGAGFQGVEIRPRENSPRRFDVAIDEPREGTYPELEVTAAKDLLRRVVSIPDRWKGHELRRMAECCMVGALLPPGETCECGATSDRDDRSARRPETVGRVIRDLRFRLSVYIARANDAERRAREAEKTATASQREDRTTPGLREGTQDASDEALDMPDDPGPTRCYAQLRKPRWIYEEG